MLCLFVLTEKSESARNGGCFDEKSVVYDRNGPKLIKDVNIEDEILTVNTDGNFQYSQVLMFLDRDSDVDRLYYNFETESGSKISTTPSHLLFVSNDNSNTSRNSLGQEEFAHNIEVGQYLYTTSGNAHPIGSHMTLERIVKITTNVGRGAYAPLTTTGNLVVNNITASCYAVIRSQTIAHLTFLPVRMGRLFVQLGDRISRLLHVTPHHKSDTGLDGQLGVHWYAKLMYNTFKYIIPNSLLYQ